MAAGMAMPVAMLLGAGMETRSETVAASGMVIEAGAETATWQG